MKRGVPVSGSATDSTTSTHPYGADGGSSCPEDDGHHEEENWNRIDSASDLDGVDGKGFGTDVDTGATIRGGALDGDRKGGDRKMLLIMGLGGGNSSGSGNGK